MWGRGCVGGAGGGGAVCGYCKTFKDLGTFVRELSLLHPNPRPGPPRPLTVWAARPVTPVTASARRASAPGVSLTFRTTLRSSGASREFRTRRVRRSGVGGGGRWTRIEVRGHRHRGRDSRRRRVGSWQKRLEGEVELQSQDSRKGMLTGWL